MTSANKSNGLKGTILSCCHGEQEGPLTPHLPNYMSVFSFFACPHFRSFSPAVLDGTTNMFNHYNFIQWRKKNSINYPKIFQMQFSNRDHLIHNTSMNPKGTSQDSEGRGWRPRSVGTVFHIWLHLYILNSLINSKQCGRHFVMSGLYEIIILAIFSFDSKHQVLPSWPLWFSAVLINTFVFNSSKPLVTGQFIKKE